MVRDAAPSICIEGCGRPAVGRGTRCGECYRAASRVAGREWNEKRIRPRTADYGAKRRIAVAEIETSAGRRIQIAIRDGDTTMAIKELTPAEAEHLGRMITNLAKGDRKR